MVTAPEVEAYLSGKPLSEAVLKQAGTMAQQAARPIDDVRASAQYRRSLVGNLLLKMVATPTAAKGE